MNYMSGNDTNAGYWDEGHAVKVLVIDDEPEIVTLLSIHLKKRGYFPLTAPNATAGLKIVEEQQPGVILLDVTMPDMDGISAISQLRRLTNAPIIMLSGQADGRTKVTALDSGADDYLVKPFNVDELLARVRVAIRRNTTVASPETPNIVGDDYLKIDLNRRLVTRGGEQVKLTPLEYNLIALLASNKDKILTRRQILQKVWGAEYGDESDILRTTLKQVRRKIEPDPANPVYILTEGRAGYRFTLPES